MNFMKYIKSKRHERAPRLAVESWKRPDVFQMREYAKRDPQKFIRPSFVHFDDKQDYIKEIKQKWQYKDGEF